MLVANIDRKKIYQGEDKKLRFVVFANEAQTLCEDVTSFTFSWKLMGPSGVVITKTSGSGIAVVGVFNSNPNLNTQKVEVSIDDTDTDLLAPIVYLHELKRTNAGVENLIAQGDLPLENAVHDS